MSSPIASNAAPPVPHIAGKRRRSIIAAVLTTGVALALIVAGILHQRGESTNQGSGWRPAGLPGTLVHSIALGRGNLAFAGVSGGIYRRGADGVWRRVLGSGEVWSVVLLADDRTVFVATGSGNVLVSRNGGVSWQAGPTLSPDGAYAVAPVPGRSNEILAGAGGGIYRSIDGGRSWTRRLRLPGSAATAFAWLGNSRSTVFAGAVAGSVNGSTQVYISRDAGNTWRVFGRGLQSTGGIMSLAVPAVGNVFTGTMGNAAWRAGVTAGAWKKVAGGMPPTNDHVAALLSPPGRPNLVFAGTLGHGVFRTTDGGSHWIDISSGLYSDEQATTVLSLAYDARAHQLLAGTAAGIYALARAIPLPPR